jgi:hypothetical protein
VCGGMRGREGPQAQTMLTVDRFTNVCAMFRIYVEMFPMCFQVPNPVICLLANWRRGCRCAKPDPWHCTPGSVLSE